MKTALENSDDETDLLGPVHCILNPVPASCLLLEEMNDDSGDINEDAVLTLDTEELAEEMANRLLEEYVDWVDGVFLEAGMQNNIGGRKNHGAARLLADHSNNPQILIKHAKFRSRPPSPSSSPTHMSQTSEHNDMYNEEENVSQDPPQTSSRDGAISRYSPPD